MKYVATQFATPSASALRQDESSLNSVFAVIEDETFFVFSSKSAVSSPL